jgi:hypothetical protein
MKDVIIVGGGASLKEGIEKDLWSQIKHKEIWSLNSAFKCMPYLPQKEFFVDVSFFKHEIDNLQSLYNQKVHIISREHFRLKGLQHQIEQWESSREHQRYFGKEALNHKVIYYGKMGLCGLFALSYAIATNYNIIYLLGFDFGSSSLTDKNTHWYQNEIQLKNIKSSGVGRPEVYFNHKTGKLTPFVEDFKYAAKEENVKIYNVSLNSNIPYYEKISYNQFFELVKGVEHEFICN